MKMRGASSDGADGPILDEETEASFENFASADLVTYEAQNKGLKETITLLDPPTQPLKYVFDVRASAGVQPILRQDGSIEFVRGGDVTFVVPVGNMLDSAEPDQAFTTSVPYELVPVSDGWRLTMTPDHAWLTSEQRVYPVMIDPSLFYYTSRDTWLHESAPNTSRAGSTYIQVGGAGNTRSRGVLDFAPPNLPSGGVVDSAAIALVIDRTQTTSGSTSNYAFFPAGKPFRNAATWNHTNFDNEAWTGGNPSGSPASNHVQLSGTGPGSYEWIGWDVTEYARHWYNGTMQNGLVLKSVGENSNRVLSFFSTTGGSPNGWQPVLGINFTLPPTVSAVTVGPCPQPCSPSNTETSSLTPTISVQVSSPNSGWVNYTFEVWNHTRTLLKNSAIVSFYTNTPVSWTVPAGVLGDDHKYWIRVRAFDGYASANSAWKSVRTDLEAVDPPPSGQYSAAQLEDLAIIAAADGISMTSAKALYGWQEEFSALVTQYYDQFPAAFSYAQLNPDGVPGARFVFKGDIPSGAAPMASGLPVTPEFEGGAPYTRREIPKVVGAAADGIRAELGLGADAAFDVAMDDSYTDVEVTIVSPTGASPVQLAEAARDSIEQSQPSSPVPQVHVDLQPDAVGQDDGLRGGVMIENDGGSWCTTGIPVRIQNDPGFYGVVSARHCANNLVNYAADGETEREALAPSTREMDWDLGDIQFYPALPGMEGLSHSFYVGVGNKRILKRIELPSDGERICAFGRTSYGTIDGRPTCAHVDKFGTSNGIKENLIRVDDDISQGGDSGGPVYHGNTVYGLVQGHLKLTGPLPDWGYVSPLYDTIGRHPTEGGMGLIANTQAVAALYAN
jgi:hypothetical protein